MQLTPEVKQFFETAGPEVGAAVAARVAQMADAVFPPQPDQDTVTLGVLNGAHVSPRGAEVRRKPKLLKDDIICRVVLMNFSHIAPRSSQISGNSSLLWMCFCSQVCLCCSLDFELAGFC